MAIQTLSIAKLENQCELVSGLLKALAHPGRLMIMGHLMGGEKTVSELQEKCGLSQSQLSQFLNRMRLEGLVSSRREGRFQVYFIEDVKIQRLIQAIQEIYCK